MSLAKTVLTHEGRAPEGAVLFLHGLLGNRANLRAFARRFVARHPAHAAVLVDLRGHGDSADEPGDDTVTSAARDLFALGLDVPLVGIVGHSFGGKVAMRAAELSEAPLERLVILDSTPSPRDVSDSEAARVIAMLRDGEVRMPHGYASREAFVDFVVAHGESRGVADWLSMSLGAGAEGRRVLKVDLDRIEGLLLDYGRADTWAGLERTARGAIVVLGSRSRVVDAADQERLVGLSGRGVSVVVAEGAGHWVHVDAPDVVEEALRWSP